MSTLSLEPEPVKALSRPKRTTRLTDLIITDLQQQNQAHLDAVENCCARIAQEGTRDVKFYAVHLQRLFWLFRQQLMRNGYLSYDRNRFSQDDRRGQ